VSRLAVVLILSAAFAYDAAIVYFARSRSISAPATASQTYVVADADVWRFARPDLADIRLYDGQSQVPYALAKQSGGSSVEETPAKVINLGDVAGHTEFDLDVSGLAQYDRVRLQLDAKNFINHAQVWGRKALNDSASVDLGGSTLYDFTAEKLGANSDLRFATASFPYLHVKLAAGIRPGQVKGASLSNFSETRAAWISAGDCAPAPRAAPKQSEFDCNLEPGVPVERIAFQLPHTAPGIPNFSRTIVIMDERGSEIQSGSISRVLVKRAGQAVSNENLSLDLLSKPDGRIRVIVQNGDDPPLPIGGVKALSFERRFYFDPRGHSSLHLYYGDPKLDAPTYDYAKFFQQDADAARAQLGPAEANPQFAGRPDDRPWSERHGVVMWAAMLVAVAALGAMALRGLKSAQSAAN
jgi:hypothetical protein